MRKALIRMLLMNFIVLGALLFIMVKIPGEAEAAQAWATIEFEESEQKANVGLGETGIVKFTGKATAGLIGPGENVQMIQLDLTVVCAWSYSITPSTLFFEPGVNEEKFFEVVVKVPNFWPFTQPGRVEVSGQTRTIPGAPVVRPISGINGIISIEPFYQLTVSCESPYIEISPGDPLVFSLKVKNDGNSLDEIKIDVDNMGDMAKEGWVVTLGQTSLTLEEKKEQVVKLSIGSPEDWTLYRNRVTRVEVTVTSLTSLTSSSEPETQKYNLFIRDKGIYIPGFEPMFALLALVIVAAAMRMSINKRK